MSQEHEEEVCEEDACPECFDEEVYIICPRPWFDCLGGPGCGHEVVMACQCCCHVMPLVEPAPESPLSPA